MHAFVGPRACLHLSKALRLLLCVPVFAGPPVSPYDAHAKLVAQGIDKFPDGKTMAALGRKLQGTCTVRAVEMPWSQARANDKDLPGAWVEINRHIKGLREQGFKRVLVAGYGFGANAALAYSGAAGQADGVVALAPEARAVGLGELPATATRMAQHIPALWVIGTDDPLHERGETFAYAKAPLHPASRYATVKADRKGTPDAAVKTVVDWIKSQE